MANQSYTNEWILFSGMIDVPDHISLWGLILPIRKMVAANGVLKFY
jgi:hypothetical protein